jgi:hypothetical protein
MLGHIFYFIGLVLFLANISILSNFFKIRKIQEWSFKFNKVTGKKPLKSEYKENTHGQLLAFEVILVMSFIWIFFGLVTKSWIIFSLMLLFNLIINLITNSFGNFTKISTLIQFIKINVITLFVALLVINHFHLHKDLFGIIIRLFL